jgi:hypothetical protein
MSDPLGKRALFSVSDSPRENGPATGEVHLPPPTRITKESLFTASGGARRFGTVVVDCSACRARTRLGWSEFAWRHLPLWLWVPWLRYSQYMSCPACERRTWLGVAWFA